MLNYISPRGRLGRGAYALAMLAILILLAASLLVPGLGWFDLILRANRNPAFRPLPGLIGAILLLWPLTCLQLNRLRDMGQSLWWALAPVAVLAVVWAWVTLTDGVSGPLIGWLRGGETLRSQMFWAFPGSHLAFAWGVATCLGGIGWLCFAPPKRA